MLSVCRVLVLMPVVMVTAVATVVVSTEESTEQNTFGLAGFNDLPTRIEFCGKLLRLHFGKKRTKKQQLFVLLFIVYSSKGHDFFLD